MIPFQGSSTCHDGLPGQLLGFANSHDLPAAEHQDKKLVPARERFDIFVTMIFAQIVVEQTPVQKRGGWEKMYLSFSIWRGCSAMINSNRFTSESLQSTDFTNTSKNYIFLWPAMIICLL